MSQSGRFSTWTVFSLLILLAGAGWTWVSRVSPGSTTPGKIPLPRQGFSAPDFTLVSNEGQEVTLSKLRGQPVLINMWASWCSPCRAEMPAMQRLYQEYHDQGFALLAVNSTIQDSRQAAVNFSSELGLSFPILFDEQGTVTNAYQLQALPTSFFVDSNGVIQEVVIGGPMSEALLRIRIEQLLETSLSK